MSNYKKIYDEKIVKSLKDEFKYSSVMQVPRLEKIVINKDLQGGVYNVGTGTLTTLEDMIKGMVEVFSDPNNRSKIVYCQDKEDTRSFVMDIENARKELGYEPKYDYISFLKDFKREKELKRFKELWKE